MNDIPFRELTRLATAIYGHQWILPLHQETGVAVSTFLNWKRGTSPMRMDNPIFESLRKILRRKSRELAKLADEADAHVAKHGTRHGRAGVGKKVLVSTNIEKTK